jgi:hypothetical protein
MATYIPYLSSEVAVCNQYLQSATAVVGALNCTTDLNVGGNLNVDGAASLRDGLRVSGDVNISENLNVEKSVDAVALRATGQVRAGNQCYVVENVLIGENIFQGALVCLGRENPADPTSQLALFLTNSAVPLQGTGMIAGIAEEAHLAGELKPKVAILTGGTLECLLEPGTAVGVGDTIRSSNVIPGGAAVETADQWNVSLGRSLVYKAASPISQLTLLFTSSLQKKVFT